MIKAWKSNPDLLYKFTDHENRSWMGDCTWVPGQWLSASRDFPVHLKTNTCLHAFTNPYVAVMMQPAYFPSIRKILWRAQGAGERITTEPTKSGYRLMRVLYPIETPSISSQQRYSFYCHIFCARLRLILELAKRDIILKTGGEIVWGEKLQREISQIERFLPRMEQILESNGSVWQCVFKWQNAFINSRRFLSIFIDGRKPVIMNSEMAMAIAPMSKVVYSSTNGVPEHEHVDIAAIANTFFGKFEEQRIRTISDVAEVGEI